MAAFGVITEDQGPWPCGGSVGHDLGMKSRVHPNDKTKYRVKNWASYDRALVRRGDVTVWLSSEAIAKWTPTGVVRRKNKPRFRDVR